MALCVGRGSFVAGGVRGRDAAGRIANAGRDPGRVPPQRHQQGAVDRSPGAIGNPDTGGQRNAAWPAALADASAGTFGNAGDADAFSDSGANADDPGHSDA
jgi:hypothetical protein